MSVEYKLEYEEIKPKKLHYFSGTRLAIIRKRVTPSNSAKLRKMARGNK
jgi:hypothetical protein